MIFPSKSKCIIHQRCIVSKENHREHRAINVDGDRVFHYKIDGDIVPKSDPHARCDYLIEDETKNRLYLIELKGTDVKRAVEQIEATIDLFADKFQGIFYPRIIHRSNTHAIASSKVNKFKRKYPFNRFETNSFEEKI